jgi:DNA-binding beta-propeller fold protein YncE
MPKHSMACLKSFFPTQLLLAAVAGAVLTMPPATRAAGAPLVAGEPMVVPDSKGGFDYLQVDEAQRRLLANHTANNTLDVFDLDSGKLLKHVPTGAAQGVAVVPELGKYFVAVSREQVVVVIDSKTLERTGSIKLAGPGDAIGYNPKNHCVYAGHDDGPHLWVIDTRTEKLVATIDIPDGPEWVLYDASTDRVFQNIKSNDSLLVIDPARNTIKERWATAPAKSPHGLALDAKTHRLFCAGTNGKIAVMDSLTGKVLASINIASGVDQITFDADLKRVYCASRNGVVSVVEETADGAVSLGDVKTGPGAKTITVDPKTHAVWVAYAQQNQSYILRLTVP